MTFGHHNLPDFGSLTSEGSGFIKEDGIHFVHQFKGASILHQNTHLGTEGKGREHGQRRRHPNACPQITVKHRDPCNRPEGCKSDATDGHGWQYS